MTRPSKSIKSAIVAAGENAAPIITLADIEGNIVSEYYFTAADGCVGAGVMAERHLCPQSLELLIFCVLVLRNGYTVTGVAACTVTDNVNYEIGRKVARQAAVEKVWPLICYERQQRMHESK